MAIGDNRLDLAEDFKGRKYVRYQIIIDSTDTPLSDGVAVYEGDNLVELAFSQINVGAMPYYNFRARKCTPSSNQWLAEQSPAPYCYQRVAATGWEIVATEISHLLHGHRGLIFKPRDALKVAFECGLISALPDGYLARDLATRVPMPGRLTEQKLLMLVRFGFIKPGMTIQLEEGAHWDIAPDKVAFLRAVAYQHPGIGMTTECDDPSAPHLQPSNKPVLIVEFPHHRVGNPPRPWLTFMESRFLRVQDGVLSYKPISDDEWLPQQYQQAEAEGVVW